MVVEAEPEAGEVEKPNPAAEILATIEKTVGEAIANYTEATAADVTRFGQAIAVSLVPVIASGNPALLAELGTHVRMLAAMNKIHARRNAEAVFNAVLDTTVSVVGKLAASFVKSLVPGGLGALLTPRG